MKEVWVTLIYSDGFCFNSATEQVIFAYLKNIATPIGTWDHWLYTRHLYHYVFCLTEEQLTELRRRYPSLHRIEVREQGAYKNHWRWQVD
jgi:hypothetical protein